ncbi:MAG: hypothetical protein K8R74_14645 [Bacteroidales bacterium]|nr:hypothetical protein [Bacteroidales bacterium]
MKESILNQLITFLVLMPLIILTSCGKPEYVHLSDEFKSFTIFPAGSYWVYEEINSGFIDTMIVERVSIEFQSEHAESNVKVESGNIQYQTRLSGKIVGWIRNSSYSEGCNTMSSILIYNSTHDTVNTAGGQFLDVGNEFFCCCDPGTISWFDQIREYSGIIDSISIGDTNFFDVKLFTTIVDDSLFIQQNLDLVKKSYFAKNVGLIKWEQFNGNEWEVRDFRINN